ncbi:MAG TPA: ABC transporter substrate-binding protein, partial [Erwinia persicina]|nr:ABC transporter substrate-binding protein [Erwinia persicina]
MRNIVPLLLASTLAFTPVAQAATPADTLVVAISLDGIISFDPAESFETVSTSSLRNVYQTLVSPAIRNERQLSPTLASQWQTGSTERSLRFTLK